MFHLNINSLQYHFDELQTFLSNCPIDSQILGISGSILKTDISTTTNIQLPGFKTEQISTKSANGGTLLYIRDTANYKLRPDLNVEKEKELESIFIEILQKTSSSVINGCIYRHPRIYPKEFNDLFLKSLRERLTKENNKEVILLGDFNIDLIKSNLNANASEFFGVIYTSNLLPHITSPTRLTSRSHTLIDNIFSNINGECTSGNIINTISDHLGQFLIIPNCSYSYNSKKEIFQRNFKNFKEQNFLSDLKKIDWDSLFSDCKQDVDLSYKKFLDKITKLLDIHAPVKKLSHKDKKSLSKPWLTKGILQSIRQKNVLYRKFIRTKDLTKRELLLQNFKFYKNTIHKLTRVNKSDYRKRYFKEHKNNFRKTWIELDLLSSLRQTLINKSDP